MVRERIDIAKHRPGEAGVANHFITSPCSGLARCWGAAQSAHVRAAPWTGGCRAVRKARICQV